MGLKNMLTPAEILVNGSGLHELQSRPPLKQYVREIWRIRAFTFLNARTRANTQGRDTFLGKAWIVLDPLIQTAFYGFVFGVILNVSRGMDNFPGFLALGIVFFRLSTRGIKSGINLIRNSRPLISSFHFPRATVVLGEALKNALDGVIPAAVAIVLALLWQLDKPVSWTILLVVPIYVLVHFFGMGCCFIVARSTAFIPDLRAIYNLISRALFFLSGVFYSIDRFVNNPDLELFMKLNPVYQFLNATRLVVLDGQVPSLFTFCYLTVWSLGLSFVGFLYFWEAEGRYASIR